MPAVRDFTQNYTSTTNSSMVCSAPYLAENDLLVCMPSLDTSTDPTYWCVGEPATAAFLDDGGVFTDYTSQFNNATTADWYMTSASPAAVNDAFYFGRSAQFNGVTVVCSTAPSISMTWVWEYYNGSTWTTLTTLANMIVTNMGTGYRVLSFNPPSDWSTTTVNSQNIYWVRMRISAYTSLTTRPVFSQGWLGTFTQIGSFNNGTSAHHAILYKIAGASEPTEYGANAGITTNDTMNSAIVSVRDIDTSLPFTHETTAALSNASTNQDSNLAIYNGSVTRAAQSFAAPSTRFTLASVEFYLKKSGSPTGTARATLYTHSGTFGTSSVPTGVALAASATFDVSTLTTSYQLIEFVFPWYQQYIMTPSTNYCIAVEYSGGDASNYVHVGYDASAPSHAGNGATYNGSWTAQSYDLVFYAYYWAAGRTTSTAGRFALPTMTTERDNSIVLYSVANAAASVPSIIEGPCTLIFGKDGAAHADAMSWGFQKTAGTTPNNVYLTALGTTWTQEGGVVAVNPPASGATVIPPYCASDSSVYITPGTGAAYLTDAAPVNTVTSNFGSTLNGKTLSASGTTYTYADTGVNSYHAMWNCMGITTANTWAGNVVVCASRDLSGKNILFHIQPYLPVDIQTTDSVALTGTCGVAIGFASTANTNYKVWHVGGANTSWRVARHQPAVIHASYTGAGMIQNTGTLNAAAVVNIGYFVSGKVVASDWLMGSIWALDTTAVAGGNSTEPLDIDGIVLAAADGHERKSVLKQGSSQFMIFQPLQIGNGGTNPVYLNLDSTALEFPQQYNKALKTVNYCSIDNVAGIKYYAGASDTIIHKNSVVSSASKYFWGLHASSSTSATYDFSGLSVIGAGTVTLLAGVTFTSVTWSGCDPFDSAGATLTSCSIKSSTSTYGLLVTSTSNMALVTGCTFSGNVRALRLSTAGTYTSNGNIFSSNTYDIDNNSAGTDVVSSADTRNTDQALGNGTITGVGESFVGNGGTLANVAFTLSKTGSPTGNLTAKIYAHSGSYGSSSVPTGSALATSQTLDVSTLTGSPTETVLYFIGEGRTTGDNNITLTNAVNYVATLEYSGGNGSNYVNVGVDTTSPAWGGNFSTYNGSWSAVAGTDAIFKVRTGGIIVVNATNGSNPSQSKVINSNAIPGSTTINVGVNITVAVLDKDTNPVPTAQVAVYKVSDDSELMNEDTETVTAGSFVTGVKYTIVTVGTTDFTIIGATSNTVGVAFTATGPGSGTGTASNGTATQTFTYESDTPIYARIRKSSTGETKYIPISTTGTITSSGYSLTTTLLTDEIA